MKKNIDEIVIRDELYPREKINQEKVKEYEQYIGVLPPVSINQDSILIDGFHRFYAYKNTNQKEIETEIVKTKNDTDLFLKAVEMNSSHGFSLSQKEKKKHVEILYNKLLDNEDCGFDVTRLKKAFSIPDSTFSDWTKNLNEKLEGQRLQLIFDLWLQNKTQQMIADEIGMPQRTVSAKILEIEQKFRELAENPDSELLPKYGFLHEKQKYLAEFSPLLYNIWNTPRIENEYQHFGNFPIEFMENLIYYYTEPFDVVYDPFAGGGVTIDVCKKWLRKYYCSDMTPIELRKDIKKWKIQDGLPDDLPSPDFVFLDPPYWKQAENKYSKDKDDLANMTLSGFYSSIESLVKNLKKKMKNGYVAFVISPTQWRNENKEFEDHIIKIINIFDENNFSETMRYVLPYSTQQYNGTQVDIAKKEKFCLSLIRDLIIFKKECK